MRKLFTVLVAGIAAVAGCSGGGDGYGGSTTAPAVFTTLAVGATSINLRVGDTQALTATALDQNDQPLSGLTLTYLSSDQSKATVTNGGVVTGVAAGTAMISVTGTVGSVSKTKDVAVTVTEPPVFTTLAVTPPSVDLVTGGTQTLTATALDQTNNPMSGLSVSYASSDQTKATVTSGGVVTAVSAGTAVVTVTGTVGSITRTRDVTVTVAQSAVFTTLAIAPSSVALLVNGTQALTATALDQNGSPMAGLSVTFVSSDATKASVTTSGLVTGVAAGTATVTATGTVGTMTKTTDVSVTVTQPGPATAAVTATAGNQFQPSQVTIARGGTVTWTFAALHNVTFQSGNGVPANIPNTSSGSVSRTFSTAGTFNYTCTIHPGMNGSVVVQ